MLYCKSDVNIVFSVNLADDSVTVYSRGKGKIKAQPVNKEAAVKLPHSNVCGNERGTRRHASSETNTPGREKK